jgi:hypothetical protein
MSLAIAALEVLLFMPLPHRLPPALAPLLAYSLLGGSVKPVVRPQSGAEFILDVIPA